MKYSEILAARIYELCRERGISINKLAHMSGLKQSTVDNIIHGASENPRLGTLQKISEGFDMSVSEFLDFKELDDYVPQ